MQLTLTLLVSCIASLQVVASTPAGYSQANPCVEQSGSCYQEVQAPVETGYESQPMPSGEAEDEDAMDSMPESDDTDTANVEPESTYSESPDFESMNDLDITALQPRQALLDNVQGHSSQEADALSNSNQYDQTQVIDQTLYHPKQQQPQIIITQPARSRGGRYKKYKRAAHRNFKIRYSSGNRHW